MSLIRYKRRDKQRLTDIGYWVPYKIENFENFTTNYCNALHVDSDMILYCLRSHQFVEDHLLRIPLVCLFVVYLVSEELHGDGTNG